MSYILEALKKAQAERQLGSAPTIHAVPMHVPVAEQAGVKRGPLLAIVAAAAALAAAAFWYVKGSSAPAQAPLVLTTAPAPAPVPAVAAPLAAVAPAPAVPAAIRPAPVIVAPPVAMPAPAAAAAPKPAEPQLARAPAAVTAPAPTPTPTPTPAPEERLQTLRELPESIQREVPAVAIGGYIYSRNPADRLLLIDKILRKEGEEVAPGLVLEKLLPKGAVMNYRGTRYRVPY